MNKNSMKVPIKTKAIAWMIIKKEEIASTELIPIQKTLYLTILYLSNQYLAV